MIKFKEILNLISEFIFKNILFRIIFISFFIVLFGTAFYLIYTDFFAIKDQINKDFNEQQLILAKQATKQVNDYINNLEIQLINLQKITNTGHEEIKHIAMENFFRQNQVIGIYEIGMIDTNGSVKYKINSLNKLNKKDTDIIISFENSGFHFGKFFIDSNMSSQFVVKTYALYMHKRDNFRKADSNNNIYCLINFSKLMENVLSKIRSGKTGYAWVIDQNGLAIYHPEGDFIGRNIFEARQERKPYVNFSKINQIMKEKMMKGIEGTGIYESWWHKDLSGEVTKLIAFSPIKSRYLTRILSIAVVAPVSEVQEAVDNAYKRHLGAQSAIILGVIVFISLIIFYQRKISDALKERVTEQEEYITSILKNSMDAIIFTDENNSIKVWNKGAEKIFEYKAKEMIGQYFHRLIPPDIDAEQELIKIQLEVQKNGYLTNYIAPRITKSGKRINVNISKTIITSSKGETLGYSLILRDETQKMELEQRIYNTEKLASMGNLAAGVAHEINNPLAIILGYADLLLEKFNVDSQEYKDLKIIETHANNAKKIVEDLLSFARVTEGMEDIINVKSCIEMVLSVLKNTLFTKKINLKFQVANDLPQIKGDVREFQQVLFNLINNSAAALKNSSNGTILINAYLLNGFVNIDITDNGTGIPEKIKQKIFDPFFTTKKVGEGTGLGLSLCYGIITKYGGRISFKSNSKEDNPDIQSGTTFNLQMPLIN